MDYKEGAKMCREKKKAWTAYIKSGKNPAMYGIYKAELNEACKTTREAKRDFEIKLADKIKSDSKSFYAYYRSKQRSKDKVGPLKDSLGKIITDNEEAANTLNTYFCSVFTSEDLNNIPDPEIIFNGKNEE